MKQFVITIHPQRIIPAKRPLPPEGRHRQRRADGTVRGELKTENGKLKMERWWIFSDFLYLCTRELEEDEEINDANTP